LTNSSNQPGIIDVHCHLYPMEYIKLLEQRNFIPRVINKNGSREFLIFPEEDGLNGVGGRPMGSEYYDLDQKIKFMDKTDIQTSVVSLGNPWLDPFPDSTGDQAALIINQKMSEYEKATQGRITAMGVLPTSQKQSRPCIKVRVQKGFMGSFLVRELLVLSLMILNSILFGVN
jgi:aminocarboxymuconate-semialdehyde decarboxylase